VTPAARIAANEGPGATPDYTLRDGVPTINDEGEALMEHHARLRDEVRHLDAARVGALLAGVFVQHPWLAAMTLQLDPAYDAGWHGVEARITAVEVVPAVPVSDWSGGSMGEGDEAADPEWLAEYQHEHLREEWTDIAYGLDCHKTDERVTFVVRRAALAGLIDHSGPLSGRACFVALVPEVAQRFRMTAHAT